MTNAATHFARKFFEPRLVAVSLLLAVLIPAMPAAGKSEKSFELGLSRSCFPNVSLNDATAAYRVFLQNIGHSRGYVVTPKLAIYEDTPQFAAAIQQGFLHLAAMDAWQFLELEKLPGIRPFFVPSVNGKVGRSYVVIARRDGTVRTIADLPGREVIRLDSVSNGVCDRWLESLLPIDPNHPAADFFASLERAAKPTAAVLPVFFGRKAACIVDAGSFELMKELNPQVGQALEVIATSAVFVDAVICLGEQTWDSPEAKTDTIDALGNLAADAAGRQVLTLFRISGLVPFQEEHLATVRALYRTVNAAQSQVNRRVAAANPASASPAVEERSP